MRPSVSVLIKTILCVIGLFMYCEYFIYYVILKDCQWPVLKQNNEDPNISKTNESSVKVMVLADTHLLGSRKGHWFDKLRREWQMHRAFQTSITLFEPDLVFVLGDLTDEGLYCSEAEFNYYVKRFHNLFAVPDGIKLYVAVGNHDIGFHYSISPYLNNRFVTAFNAPAVQLISVRGNHFILVNSMALEGDGCFLCKPAERQLTQIEILLKCTNGTAKDKCDTKRKLNVYSKPVLMQHYPLYRQSDADCTDFDAAPDLIKNERFREGWECLSKEATMQLLKQIRPRLVLSGHTHHGCTRELPNKEGLEITIPSFSWRNKKNPTFGMAIFTPNNYAFAKCAMPSEPTVINIYIFGGLILTAWFLYCIYRRPRDRKFKVH